MDRKNQDCYFYYYSTCTKGDQCVFRHEPSALGCETVCPFWQQRKCDNRFCSLRHMELKKNRKSIPCYWENQPGGCRKPHCPFLHKNPRDPHQMAEVDKKECEQQVTSSQPPLDRGDWSRGAYEHSQGHIQVASDGDTARMGPRRISQGNVNTGPVTDPLVVSFDDCALKFKQCKYEIFDEVVVCYYPKSFSGDNEVDMPSASFTRLRDSVATPIEY